MSKQAAGRTQKELFIRQLAVYLAGDQTEKGIKLSLGQPEAKEWDDLRGRTPLFGYPTVDEAEKILTRFLS